MVNDFEVRRLEIEDYGKGFLKTLQNLTVVGEVSRALFDEIFGEISRSFGFYNIFVAEREGEVIGTITLLVERKFIHAGGRAGHIEDLSVRAGFEKRGIGTALVERAVEEAKTRGCYKVVLDCSERNAPFYEKRGFRRDGLEMRMDF